MVAEVGAEPAANLGSACCWVAGLERALCCRETDGRLPRERLRASGLAGVDTRCLHNDEARATPPRPRDEEDDGLVVGGLVVDCCLVTEGLAGAKGVEVATCTV